MEVFFLPWPVQNSAHGYNAERDVLKNVSRSERLNVFSSSMRLSIWTPQRKKVFLARLMPTRTAGFMARPVLMSSHAQSKGWAVSFVKAGSVNLFVTSMDRIRLA